MKNITVTLFIVFSISSFNYGQSILHPDKFGFAFHYGYSYIHNIDMEKAAIVVSPKGPLDLFLSISGEKSISSVNNQVSAGFSYHINNKITNHVVPAIGASFSYSNNKPVSAVSIEAVLNINAYRAKYFSFIPVFGLGLIYRTTEDKSYSFYDNSQSSSETNFFAAISFGFASQVEDLFVITFSPEIGLIGFDFVISATAGIGLTPF